MTRKNNPNREQKNKIIKPKTKTKATKNKNNNKNKRKITKIKTIKSRK